MNREAASAASPLPSPAVADDFAEGLDGDGEQVGPGDAAGRAAAAEVRLQHGEAVVAHLHRVADAVGDVAVAATGEHAVLVTRRMPTFLPVLDVEVAGVRLGLLPSLDRIEVA